ncbi:Ulp1 protease family, carboxy-terminal domain protein [Arachis hypogaea]|nr:Ulp1 protease family, carboxy-terminal domain protein [Arachis hypogaea]
MKTRLVDVGTSTDDPPVEQSIVERDGTEEGSKVSEGMDTQILNLLDCVEEQLGQEDKVTGTVIKTHTEQIKKLTEVIVGHGKKSELPAATKSRGRSKKKDPKGEDTLLTRAKCKRHVEVAVKTCKSTNPPLKRKLDFDNDEDDDCTMEIMQQDHGTPFTYGTNMAMYMESANMPLCLDLLFRPPPRMEFVESELAVAAYIFGNGLSKEEILIPDEHCYRSRGALHSLLPGEEVVDNVLNLVASMMTASNLDEFVIIRGWFPLNFYVDIRSQQFAFNPTNHWPETLAFIRNKYMKKADELIYVCLNKDRHWYLVVIDLLNGALVYLDSAKAETVTERKARLDQIRYVAFFLENMFRDGNFFEDKEHTPQPTPVSLNQKQDSRTLIPRTVAFG